MPVNRGEPVAKQLPDNNKNKRGFSMFNCVSGRVPPRLVCAWEGEPRGRLVQIVFEWEAEWPCKFVIECHDGQYIVARSDRLPWPTVNEFLSELWTRTEGNFDEWYLLVLARLREEGGSTV